MEYLNNTYRNSTFFKGATSDSQNSVKALDINSINDNNSSSTKELKTDIKNDIVVPQPKKDEFIPKTPKSKDKNVLEKVLSAVLIGSLAVLVIGAIMGIAKNKGSNIGGFLNFFNPKKSQLEPLTRKAKKFMEQTSEDIKQRFGIRKFGHDKFYLRPGTYDSDWNLINHDPTRIPQDKDIFISVFRKMGIVDKNAQEKTLNRTIIEIRQPNNILATLIQEYKPDKGRNVYTYTIC